MVWLAVHVDAWGNVNYCIIAFLVSCSSLIRWSPFA